MTCEVCGEMIAMGNQGGYLLSGKPLCGECITALKLLYEHSDKLGNAIIINIKRLKEVLKNSNLLHKSDAVINFLLKYGATPFGDMKGRMRVLGIKNEVVDEWMWQEWTAKGLKRVWNEKLQKWEWI